MLKYLFLLLFIYSFAESVEANDVNTVLEVLRNNVSSEIVEAKLRDSISIGLWNKEHDYFVSALKSGNTTLVYVISFFEGKYIFTDASHIARFVSDFEWAGAKKGDKNEVIPIKIDRCDKKSCLMQIRKRIWIKGKRYTKIRLLVVGRNGTLYHQ
jgi:hypothetical protein